MLTKELPLVGACFVHLPLYTAVPGSDTRLYAAEITRASRSRNSHTYFWYARRKLSAVPFSLSPLKNSSIDAADQIPIAASYPQPPLPCLSTTRRVLLVSS